MKNRDLGVNFFLTTEDVDSKLSRAVAAAPRLQELNSMCVISVEPTLTEEVILQHSALIITVPTSLPNLIEYDTFCRGNHISFLYALTCGISTSIFVDHGPSHVVHDSTGERPVQKLITSITAASDTELLIRYDHPAGQLPVAINNNLHFEITDVLGPVNLNNQVFEIKRFDSDPVKTVRVQVPDASEALSTPYISGGMLTEKKVPRPHPMESFADKVKSPGSTWAEPQTLVLTDLLNIGSETQQHVAFCALLQYAEDRRVELGAGDLVLPSVYDESEAERLVICAKQLLSTGSIAIEDFELDDSFISR